MKVVERPLEKLLPDPRNARDHDDKNLAAIIGSLEAYGQVEPLVVQKSTGIVVGGNARLEAMKKLGWATARVHELDIDDDKARSLGLALNRTAELGEWNGKALADALNSLLKSDFDLASIGFDEKDVQMYAGDDLDLAAAPMGDDAFGGQAGDFPGGDPTAAVAHVKLIQLFYDEDRHKTFMGLADRLRKATGTDNISDVVLEALQGQAESLADADHEALPEAESRAG